MAEQKAPNLAEAMKQLAQNLRECGVCKENFDDDATKQHTPRLLRECIHSFCSACLAKLLEQGTAERPAAPFIRCPTCRAETPVPRGKTVDEALLEDRQRLGILSDFEHWGIIEPTHELCVLCLQCDPTLFCHDCVVPPNKTPGALLCEECSNTVHKGEKSTRLTQLHIVESADKRTWPEPRCELHNKRLEWYCRTCR